MMSSRQILAVWITAVLMIFSIAARLQANERSHEHHEHPIIYTHKTDLKYKDSLDRGNIVVIARNHAHFAKDRYRKKMRKIRRMRRLHTQKKLDRPTIIVTREH